MRPGGKEGFGYKVAFGAQIEGDGTTPLTAGFYQVVERAEEASGLPAKDAGVEDGQDIGPGDIFYGTSEITPATGDTVKPMTLTFLSFVKDIEKSSSKQKFDDTTQEDVKSGIKSFTESALSETTGSISGYYETGSEAQEEIEGRFAVIISDDGAGNVTRKPVKTGVWPFMMSRRETTEVGEVEVWEYKPMIIDQLTQRKPLEGTQEFNFNYTVDGKSHPAVFKRVIPA